MKRLLSLTLLLFASLSMISCKGSKVLLRSDLYSFDTQKDSSDGFTLVVPLTLSDFGEDTELLCIPGVVKVQLRQHNPKDIEVQNYPAFKMPDGRCPVLEAVLTLYPPTGDSPRDMKS